MVIFLWPNSVLIRLRVPNWPLDPLIVLVSNLSSEVLRKKLSADRSMYLLFWSKTWWQNSSWVQLPYWRTSIGSPTNLNNVHFHFTKCRWIRLVKGLFFVQEVFLKPWLQCYLHYCVSLFIPIWVKWWSLWISALINNVRYLVQNFIR